MDEQTFITEAGLAYSYTDGQFVVTNPGWLGLVHPGDVQGVGATLAEALAAAMAVISDDCTAAVAPALIDAYVGQDGADEAVVVARRDGIVVADVKLVPVEVLTEVPVEPVVEPLEGL